MREHRKLPSYSQATHRAFCRSNARRSQAHAGNGCIPNWTHMATDWCSRLRSVFSINVTCTSWDIERQQTRIATDCSRGKKKCSRRKLDERHRPSRSCLRRWGGAGHTTDTLKKENKKNKLRNTTINKTQRTTAKGKSGMLFPVSREAFFDYFRLNLDLDLNLAEPFLAPLFSRLLGSNSVNLYLDRTSAQASE